jgi:uncharacterized protein YgbK (DUF1537 family)
VRGGRPGVILVGSHVAKTSAQLAYLWEHTDVVPVHVDVRRLRKAPDGWGVIAGELVAEVHAAHARGRTAVIHTSREELRFPDQATRLDFGERLSAFLMELVRQLPETIGFLISKGGITSNDVLSSGLRLTKSRVLGQILTGCSLVRCPAGHGRYPDLPVVIFPGNVGDETALARVYAILAGGTESPSLSRSA